MPSLLFQVPTGHPRITQKPLRDAATRAIHPPSAIHPIGPDKLQFAATHIFRTLFHSLPSSLVHASAFAYAQTQPIAPSILNDANTSVPQIFHLASLLVILWQIVDVKTWPLAQIESRTNILQAGIQAYLCLACLAPQKQRLTRVSILFICRYSTLCKRLHGSENSVISHPPSELLIDR